MKQVLKERPNPKDCGNFILFDDGSTACEVDGNIISSFEPDAESIALAKWFGKENQANLDKYRQEAMRHAEHYKNASHATT